jgi:ribonuclease R
MPEIYKRQIIKMLQHADYKPLRQAQLAKSLGIKPQDHPRFKEAFEQLHQAGRVVISAKNLVSLPGLADQITGRFRANPKGFGFVCPLEPNSHADLFIPPNSAGDAMTGDIVVAKVKSKVKRGEQIRYSGEIIEVVERAQNRFVGTLVRQAGEWLIQPDGKDFFEPISVDDVGAKAAHEKDKVVVEILSYPTEKYLARGVIVEVLGKAGRYDSEIKSIIHRYHLPVEFDDDCIRQARQAASRYNPEQAAHRQDLTGKVIITIDPPDAKDFDDAISLEKDSAGNFVLGVHIADVSSFIPADSPLDDQARIRGNSVYLPGKTIPMLPEILSNGICSLQPDQKRFTKSVFLTYDKRGEVVNRRYANSIISSAQRLTYEQADKSLKGRIKGIKPQVIELLKSMETLARVIEKRRLNNGMLQLDLPQTELVMDKSGRVVDAHPADTSYPHTIIEMFMVEANEAVASLLDRINVPFMRRIHPEPDILSLKKLAEVIRAFGYSLPRHPDRSAIQDLLSAVKNADCSYAINMLVLRSLERAQYSPLHIGHYALASNHYCHFTSPIRRYADLLVHRLLESYLHHRSISPAGASAGLDLVEIGKHITFTEQCADDAEKDLTTVLILQMLSGKIGDELDCVVTGLANFGVFVQSKKFGIEGLIQIADLGPDKWDTNEKTQCIVGRLSGSTIRLGQAIKVQIISVNVPARQLSVRPVKQFVKEQRPPDRDKYRGKKDKRRRKR